MAARSRRAAVPFAVAALCAAVAVAILVHVHDYKQHAAATGRHLVTALTTSAARHTDASGSCIAPEPSDPSWGDGARMILDVPSLGLRAPVLPGTTDKMLDEGVGHLEGSNWPDQGWTQVLEAHDVTFFGNLDHIHVGATVTLTAPCRTWSYRVTKAQVMHRGDPVPNVPATTLVMVTCYPTNALFTTDWRYVVTSTLVSATTSNATSLPGVQTFAPPAASILPGRSFASLMPDPMGLHMGTMTVAASLGSAFRSSAAALRTANNLLATFSSGLIAVDTASRHGWATVAVPGLAMPTGRLPDFATTTEDLHLLGQAPSVTGGTVTVRDDRTGAVVLTVRETVWAGRLVIADWR